MSLSSQLVDEIRQLAGATISQPIVVTVADSGVVIHAEVTAADALSCALRSLTLEIPGLSGAGIDTLKEWAAALCGRITYLLEQIGPLEYDEQHGEVLIRSNPPQQQNSGTRYYEVLLSSSGQGRFRLQRFEAVRGQPGRQPVDIHTTYEVITKLVDDLLDTQPVP